VSLFVARSWFKYAMLLGCSATILYRSWTLSTINGPPTQSPSTLSSLTQQRSNSETTKNNVALRPPELRPDAATWNTLTRQTMADFLQCDYYNERPIHAPETWIGLREAYISVVGQEQSTVDLTANPSFETAFRVPFEVRQSPGKGRGIFVLGSVHKGETLYDFSQSAQFHTGSDFAEFLRILRPELACDVLMWSYVQYFGEGVLGKTSDDIESQKTDLRIVTDLDPGSFCNNGGWKKGNMAWLNANGGIAKGYENPSYFRIRRMNGLLMKGALKSAPLVAVKDIEAGEELFCIYDQFSEGLNLMIP